MAPWPPLNTPLLAERCCENLQSAKGLARCKFGPAITWLVGVAIYCTIFDNNSVIQLYLAGFYAQNTF